MELLRADLVLRSGKYWIKCYSCLDLKIGFILHRQTPLVVPPLKK